MHGLAPSDPHLGSVPQGCCPHSRPGVQMRFSDSAEINLGRSSVWLFNLHVCRISAAWLGSSGPPWCALLCLELLLSCLHDMPPASACKARSCFNTEGGGWALCWHVGHDAAATAIFNVKVSKNVILAILKQAHTSASPKTKQTEDYCEAEFMMKSSPSHQGALQSESGLRPQSP